MRVDVPLAFTPEGMAHRTSRVHAMHNSLPRKMP